MPTYPLTPFKVPWIHVAIENAGAVASGLWRAFKVKRKTNVNIVPYVGDGATYDIGFQALSGAIDRGDHFIYVCYNNESFGNTGVQKSSATPFGAWTSITPKGNPMTKKSITKIIAAHDCPYVATACVSYPIDFMKKLQKAAKIRGPKFIDLLTPCQPGWGYDPSQMVNVGKLAVETGAWPLYEIENGQFRLTKSYDKLKPVKEYLKVQGRFEHLSEASLNKIQFRIDQRWDKLVEGKFWEV